MKLSKQVTQLYLYLTYIVNGKNPLSNEKKYIVLHLEAQLQMDFSKGLSPQTFLFFDRPKYEKFHLANWDLLNSTHIFEEVCFHIHPISKKK